MSSLTGNLTIFLQAPMQYYIEPSTPSIPELFFTHGKKTDRRKFILESETKTQRWNSFLVWTMILQSTSQMTIELIDHQPEIRMWWWNPMIDIVAISIIICQHSLTRLIFIHCTHIKLLQSEFRASCRLTVKHSNSTVTFRSFFVSRIWQIMQIYISYRNTDGRNQHHFTGPVQINLTIKLNLWKLKWLTVSRNINSKLMTVRVIYARKKNNENKT